MLFKKSSINNAIVMATVLVSTSAFANITLSSLPGARANAMGGSYIAIANDTSSLFYNPAGIAGITGGELMLEYGDIVIQDTENLRSWLPQHLGQPITTEREIKFVGGVVGKAFGDESGIQIGMSYAPNLYNMSSQIFGDFDNFNATTNESIKFETSVEQLSLGLAGNFSNLAWGITFDYQDYSTDISYTDVGRQFDGDNNPTGCLSTTFCPMLGEKISEFSAYGYTAGLLWRSEFGEDNLSSFSLGAVYRNYSDAEEFRDLEVDDITSTKLKFSSPVAPTSWGVGAAIDFPILESSQLLLTAQYENQDFGTVTDDYNVEGGTNRTDAEDSEWERISGGAELSFLADSGWQWFIRAGYYTAEDSNFASERLEFAKVTALTSGLGVYIPGFGKLEATLEKRDVDNSIPENYTPKTDGLDTYDVSLLSVSYTYVWF
jgi:hypothetical protein